jgi:hypothetical protein
MVVLVAGALVGRILVVVGRRLSDEPRPVVETPAPRPEPWAILRLAAAGAVVLVVAGLTAGVSLVTTARSAYVPAADEPIVTVRLLGDGTLTAEPATVPAGRLTISSGVGEPIRLYGPLTPGDQAALRAGRIDHSRDVYWTPGLRRADLRAPGRYAFVVLDPRWEMPSDPAAFEAWDGTVPVTAVRQLEVTAPPPRAGLTTEAGGDGGRHLTLPLVAALAIEGWAAAGGLLLVIGGDRRWTAPRLVASGTVGVVTAAVVAVLASLAIGQAHSPF